MCGERSESGELRYVSDATPLPHSPSHAQRALADILGTSRVVVCAMIRILS